MTGTTFEKLLCIIHFIKKEIVGSAFWYNFKKILYILHILLQFKKMYSTSSTSSEARFGKCIHNKARARVVSRRVLCISLYSVSERDVLNLTAAHFTVTMGPVLTKSVSSFLTLDVISLCCVYTHFHQCNIENMYS